MNIKNYSFFLCSLLFIATINAQNPIVPPGTYIADPSAHVWEDGKLYVYGSLDESTGHYCSYRHHVLSTSDLKNWGITKNVFSSRGENDQVPYSDALLFAPDCQYKDGTYYLYYCQPDRNAAEGVVEEVSIRVKPLQKGGNILVRFGQPWHQPIAKINVPGDENGDWKTITQKIEKTKGTHAVWLTFYGAKDELFEIDWFEFN